MGEVAVRAATEADAVGGFLDGQWAQIDAEPWPSAKVALVAERDGRVIGAAVGSYDAGVAHLSELMIAAGERDGGLGARLLAAFEAWAAAQGAHKLTLYTDRDRPAVPFYERHGWRTAYAMENHYQHRTFLLMTKAVASGASA